MTAAPASTPAVSRGAAPLHASITSCRSHSGSRTTFPDVPGAAPRLPVDARGRAAPWPTWQLWQYASDGRVDGVAGAVDLDRFHGDEDALRSWWG